jgi:hypothetical protein
MEEASGLRSCRKKQGILARKYSFVKKKRYTDLVDS